MYEFWCGSPLNEGPPKQKTPILGRQIVVRLGIIDAELLDIAINALEGASGYRPSDEEAVRFIVRSFVEAVRAAEAEDVK